jgi:hypothetical protein
MTSAVITGKLNVAKEFSETPGPRCRKDGEFSGEEFLENHLNPAYLKARAENGVLLVDLDGTAGYATSFLEEAFGGLARKYPKEEVGKRLEFKSDDEAYLIDDIRTYIREANDE